MNDGEEARALNFDEARIGAPTCHERLVEKHPDSNSLGVSPPGGGWLSMLRLSPGLCTPRGGEVS
jgi:hypothetical protein